MKFIDGKWAKRRQRAQSSAKNTDEEEANGERVSMNLDVEAGQGGRPAVQTMKMEADYVMSTKFVHHTYREPRSAVMRERRKRNRIEITTA